MCLGPFHVLIVYFDLRFFSGQLTSNNEKLCSRTTDNTIVHSMSDLLGLHEPLALAPTTANSYQVNTSASHIVKSHESRPLRTTTIL